MFLSVMSMVITVRHRMLKRRARLMELVAYLELRKTENRWVMALLEKVVRQTNTLPMEFETALVLTLILLLASCGILKMAPAMEMRLIWLNLVSTVDGYKYRERLHLILIILN